MKSLFISLLGLSSIAITSCGATAQQGGIAGQLAGAAITNQVAKKDPATAYRLAAAQAQAQQSAAIKQAAANPQADTANQAAGLIQSAQSLRTLIGQ